MVEGASARGTSLKNAYGLELSAGLTPPPRLQFAARRRNPLRELEMWLVDHPAVELHDAFARFARESGDHAFAQVRSSAVTAKARLMTSTWFGWIAILA